MSKKRTNDNMGDVYTYRGTRQYLERLYLRTVEGAKRHGMPLEMLEGTCGECLLSYCNKNCPLYRIGGDE